MRHRVIAEKPLDAGKATQARFLGGTRGLGRSLGSHFGKVEIDDITERPFLGRTEIDGPSRLPHCRQLGDRPLVGLGVAEEIPGLIGGTLLANLHSPAAILALSDADSPAQFRHLRVLLGKPSQSICARTVPETCKQRISGLPEILDRLILLRRTGAPEMMKTRTPIPL
jgi:hypothetical protein